MITQDIFQRVLDQQASDLHLLVGAVPTLRIHGELNQVKDMEPVEQKDMDQFLSQMLSSEQLKQFEIDKELDFSYQFTKEARFRANVYQQLGTYAAAFRFIPNQVNTIDELQLPAIFHDVTKLKQGLVLFTGPTGEGKSTSLAALIDEINKTRAEHIITIEDPIEFVYKPALSIISQREVHRDTHHWAGALRSVLREDPDVVLIGEMRDLETISAALTIAETGHLVFATLHTNSAAQTVDRIIDVFPEFQQAQIRQQLASTLAAVFSQRLIPTRKDGRVVAVEILIANHAVKNLIREGKSFQIDNVIQTSSDAGMVAMETSLINWVKSGLVDQEIARAYSMRPDEFDRMLKG